MSKRYVSPNLKLYIGDVQDNRRILKASPGVYFIFHAATLKPSLASSATAITLRNPLPSAHVAASPVHSAATYRVPGR
jgi:hypothetical protein